MDKRATENERQTRPQAERDGPHRTVEQLFRDSQGQPMFADPSAVAYQVDPSLIQQGLDLAKQTGGYAAAAIKDGYDVLGSAITTPSPFGADMISGMPQGLGIPPGTSNPYQRLVTQYFDFVGSLTRMFWGQGQNPVNPAAFGQSQFPQWPGMGSPLAPGASEGQPASSSAHLDPNNPASYLYAQDHQVAPGPTQAFNSWLQEESGGPVGLDSAGRQTASGNPFGADFSMPPTQEPPTRLTPVRFENSLHTNSPTTLNAFWHDAIPEGELQLQPLRSVSDDSIAIPPITTRWVFNSQSRTQRLAISIEPSCLPGCYAAAIIDSKSQPCGQIVVTIDAPFDVQLEAQI